MKDLFKGKKAIATIPLALVIAIAILPFAIGGGLGFLAFKRISNTKLKFASIAIIATLTLFLGSAWAAGISSPSKTQSAQTESEVIAKVDSNESQAIKPV